jgi:hypothetical protein
VFWGVLASPGHPQGNSLYISEGVQAFTLLVVFLLYHDKMFTKMNSFLYTVEAAYDDHFGTHTFR